MDDAASQLLQALDLLDDVADSVTADEAADEFDEATLQTFWREWPQASAWAGALWRRLNAELEEPASGANDPDVDEVGGSG